jgi:hypothetical protein
MTPFVSSLIFSSVLYAAFLCAIVVEIFVVGHFEGAIGTRFDNLLLSAVLSIPISLLVTTGYGAVLAYRSRNRGQVGLARRWVVGSALVACPLGYAYGFVAVALGLPRLWPLGLISATVYFVALGALIAVSAVTLARGPANAA